MAVVKGWQAAVYKDGTAIGRATGVTIDISRNPERVYEFDSQDPVEVVTGNREISVTIEKFWVDTTYLDLLTASGSISSFTLLAYKQVASGEPYIQLDCYVESGSIEIPQDGFLTESITCIGVNPQVGTQA